MSVICDYCGRSAKLITGQQLYPHRPDLAHIQAWQCKPCNAHVGCHDGTDKPKGRLANSQLRRAKIAAHAAFDPIWMDRFKWKSEIDPKYKKSMARGGRYKKLAKVMGLPREKCHIGMMDVSQCYEVVKICNEGRLND